MFDFYYARVPPVQRLQSAKYDKNVKKIRSVWLNDYVMYEEKFELLCCRVRCITVSVAGEISHRTTIWEEEKMFREKFIEINK